MGGRFIPASAGNTCAAPSAAAPPAVHPRERGEHKTIFFRIFAIIGSSPRARGTRRSMRSIRSWRRFIPASAGNTTPPRARVRRPPVHPRERGEHYGSKDTLNAGNGSSPRARGTRSTMHRPLAIARFIPASAGNTCSRARSSIGTSVHPRERGEHSISGSVCAASVGSSPRARGTPCRSMRKYSCVRFIPASAGNTGSASNVGWSAPVHPRERGEHAEKALPFTVAAGSSPRARGTRASGVIVHPHRRFIPASAGNTRDSADIDVPNDRFIPASAGNTAHALEQLHHRAVHPRERGEHLFAIRP